MQQQPYLYIDIETVPSHDPAIRAEISAAHAVDDALPEIRPAANLRDPEKIAADIAARTERALRELADAKIKAAAAAEKEWRDTALDGGSGHIAVIGYSLGAGAVATAVAIPPAARAAGRYDYHPGAERIALSSFFATIDPPPGVRPPIVVGHHVTFDVRFIFQRAVIIGVPLPPWWPVDARPWDRSRINDTMTMWAGERDRISLDRLCRCLGVGGKGDIDGSKVWDALAAGRISDVVNYCRDDVTRARECHRRMLAATSPWPVDDTDDYVTAEVAR